MRFDHFTLPQFSSFLASVSVRMRAGDSRAFSRLSLSGVDTLRGDALCKSYEDVFVLCAPRSQTPVRGHRAVAGLDRPGSADETGAIELRVPLRNRHRPELRHYPPLLHPRRRITSLKLRYLEPKLQKLFDYDPLMAAEVRDSRLPTTRVTRHRWFRTWSRRPNRPPWPRGERPPVPRTAWADPVSTIR